MYVVKVTVGDGLSLVVCHLCNFNISRLAQVFCYLSVSLTFFVPHVGMSAWCLKCINIWALIW